MERHNEKNPSSAVFVGDRIAEVNGKSSADEMLYELTVGEVLDITLRRESVSAGLRQHPSY